VLSSRIAHALSRVQGERLVLDQIDAPASGNRCSAATTATRVGALELDN
jgi:hypothetical protein